MTVEGIHHLWSCHEVLRAMVKVRGSVMRSLVDVVTCDSADVRKSINNKGLSLLKEAATVFLAVINQIRHCSSLCRNLCRVLQPCGGIDARSKALILDLFVENNSWS